MDEEITIINEKTRNEKIRNFFIENKKILISIIAVIFLLIIAKSSSIIKSYYVERIEVFHHFYNILIHF